MRSNTAYVPAIIFLLASGLLLPFLFLLSKASSGIALQVSVLIMLMIIASLICGVVIREIRFYAYVIATIGIALRAASVMFSPVSSDGVNLLTLLWSHCFTCPSLGLI
ncbi:MAG: hypothetical protein ABSD99_12000 [Candidatus Bathyarchaeia archaeon]